MKKSTLFFLCFLITHIFFVFFYIHKESKIIKLSYKKQKNEKVLKELTKQKQDFKQTILAMQNHLEIKEFAQKNLNMQKIKIDQCRIFDYDKSI